MAQDNSLYNMLQAAQIFGYATNLYSQQQESRLNQRAYDIQAKQETLRAATQASENAQQLAKVLATQQAILAAKGQKGLNAPSQSALKQYAAQEMKNAFATQYNLSSIQQTKTLNKMKFTQASANLIGEAIKQQAELLK